MNTRPDSSTPRITEDCNNFSLELTGWEREVVYGHNWFEDFIPDGHELLARYRQWIETNTMPLHFEGNALPLQLSLGAATAENGAALRTAMIKGDAHMYADKNSKKQQLNKEG